ncbi:lipoyl(octanoyl) transferase LipB [Halotalea alkalilenta]|uniref:lipoyl(octanoyl) transferase LipB n=1 Tax=Halotalea alkalilenta TaxID=376489 RepID=UPI0007D0B2A6|nr:lipoyl(octanoyl) transferase LipB [Halotalea alkalilenta]
MNGVANQALARPAASDSPQASGTHPIEVYRLGLVDYPDTLAAMRAYTDERGPDDPDQIWVVEHPPVFTQGQAGRAEHLLEVGDIPVVQADRGGQVTYHGPGQLVFYLLLDLKRCGLGVRALVSAIERAVIDALASHRIEAYARPDAPGVYVRAPAGGEAKVASLGLRVRRGCSFHGVAYNVDMDLRPFNRIDPCGYAGMRMTQLSELAAAPVSLDIEADRWLEAFAAALADGGDRRPVTLRPTTGLPDCLADISRRPGCDR